MSKQKSYEVVEVIWNDAEELGDTGWNNLKEQLKESKKPCPVMKSVGYVVHRDDSHISLLSTMGKDVASTLEKIPMPFVVSVKLLTCRSDTPNTAKIS